jgi:excinuclease ABC subunit C
VKNNLEKKLKQLPNSPGVYFYKSKSGEIIYIGKAAVLKNRVRQYFQKARVSDAKTDALVAEIADIDWTETETELDALFLESEMVKRYKPRYNILLRDDKSYVFVRIDMNNPYPHVSFTRQPQDDNAQYFGPYYAGWAVKKALRYLRRVFPYSTHAVMPRRVCLQYHIGLCPGVEEQKINSREYKKILKKLIRYLKGERKQVMKEIEREMKKAAKEQRFEDAARLRNQLRNLHELQRQIIFRDREFMDISKDFALSELKNLLDLPEIPKRIEGYDISHMSGTNNVASMVVATNGLADKSQYRKFKMQLPGNNDFGHMKETLSRRFSKRNESWPRPELILIDGGKGQVNAVLEALREKEIDIPLIGLAKRLETIIIPRENEELEELVLPQNSHLVKLLQRIRDESHRFAVSYHSNLKRKGQTKSKLDDIPGVGPATRRKLLQSFGSLRGVESVSKEQLTSVLGEKKAEQIWQWLNSADKLSGNDKKSV